MSPFFVTFPIPPAAHVHHEARLGSLQEICNISFPVQQRYPSPFLNSSSAFFMSDEGQGLLQLSQTPGHTKCLMGKALLSKTGHAEGPTQPLLLKEHQGNSTSSSIWGGRLHCFLQICFSLSQLITFPGALQLCVLGDCESSPENIAQTGCTSSTTSHVLITIKSPYIPSLIPF